MHIRETLSPQEFEHALRAKGEYICISINDIVVTTSTSCHTLITKVEIF